MVHGVELLLVSAIGGYWVLERAETHTGQLKSVGRLLGAIIIVLSLAGVACRVWALSSMGGDCPFTGRGMGNFRHHHAFPAGGESTGEAPQ